MREKPGLILLLGEVDLTEDSFVSNVKTCNFRELLEHAGCCMLHGKSWAMMTKKVWIR